MGSKHVVESNQYNIIQDNELINRWKMVCEQIKTQQHSTNSHSKNSHSKDSDCPVTLIAVSKTKPFDRIAALAKAGQVDFGENYLQEALDKILKLRQISGCEHIQWHYIGRIQRNKTREIAENFAWVQTVERSIIAKRLHDQRPDHLPALNVLIQINIDREESKSGCMPDELEALIVAIKVYDRLTLRGLMIIPKHGHTNAFERTKTLFDQIANNNPQLKQWDTLSMGMSADIQEAIAHGATMVRVGSAIFGARD